MRESSTYQAILQEGRSEGEVIEARKLLRVFGDRLFGPPDAATAAALDALTDLGQLEGLCQRMHTATSWQELLGSLRPAPRRRRRPTP